MNNDNNFSNFSQTHSDRIKYLNLKPILNDNDYLVYWLQSAQRTIYNHALEYSILLANELKKNLIVFFALLPNYPSANLRHYEFMLHGLQDIKKELTSRKIPFIIQLTDAIAGVLKISKSACCIITDCGYLRHQLAWRRQIAETANCAVIQLETEVLIPVETVSKKEEYSARTIRLKINKLFDDYLIPINQNKLILDSLNWLKKTKKEETEFQSLDISNIAAIKTFLNIDKTIGLHKNFYGGQNTAQKKFISFINTKLEKYEEFRNHPGLDFISGLSPYLHFGQISVVQILIELYQRRLEIKAAAFIEELIVRRELAINFVYYNKFYDSFDALDAWAKRTLIEHQNDMRPVLYNLSQLENAQTDDIYWNAAQTELLIAGKMHGYMRMYWGKKIIEWTSAPEQAFEYMRYLNDKYEIDGRDANGYAGICWCFGKHDRAWQERPVFGKIRYMNAAGLERKFDMRLYLKKVKEL